MKRRKKDPAKATGALGGWDERAREPDTLFSRLAPSPLASRLTILIVADDRTDSTGAEIMLAGRGHLVRTVKNQAEALQALAENTFDLALIDLDLPGQDGFLTAEKLRELGPLRVVGMTAQVERHDRKTCLNQGLDGFLLKPFLAAALLDELERLDKT
ncbi:MAG: response regulator [Thermodesulfobacteriota bacterium]